LNSIGADPKIQLGVGNYLEIPVLHLQPTIVELDISSSMHSMLEAKKSNTIKGVAYE
jgi:hypothetical protein